MKNTDPTGLRKKLASMMQPSKPSAVPAEVKALTLSKEEVNKVCKALHWFGRSAMSESEGTEQTKRDCLDLAHRFARISQLNWVAEEAKEKTASPSSLPLKKFRVGLKDNSVVELEAELQQVAYCGALELCIHDHEGRRLVLYSFAPGEWRTCDKYIAPPKRFYSYDSSDDEP